MALIMIVTLYTSRIVLRVLGVEDFGIYSVVGGVVFLLAFLNNSLSITTQRFLNYEMANNDTVCLSKVFSTAVNIHYLIALLVFILAETIGIWFVNTQLVIPLEKLSAALWVYQVSVFTVCINIISIPYNAAIIATERMNIYAYVSVIEAVLKLSAACLLIYLSFDKLKLYVSLLFIVAVTIRMIYTFYCKRNLIWCRYKFIWDRGLLKKMLNFSGWTIFGTSTELLSIHGISILINIFFNPVHNTAQAIAMQVKGAIRTFSMNFMVSVRPQIVKSFSRTDYNYVYQLVFTSSKFSYYLLFILSFPILLQTGYLLNLWLGKIPDYSIIFTRLALIDVLIIAVTSPLAATSQASGKIRNYQLIISVCYTTTFVVTAILYTMKFSSHVAFITTIVMSIIGLILRTIELKFSANFPVKRFFAEVIFPILSVTVVSIILPLLYYFTVSINYQTFIQLILTLLLTTLSILITIWSIGLNSKEKKLIKNKIYILKTKIKL
jgi:O-antigen/teichoic acid export membrane protein